MTLQVAGIAEDSIVDGPSIRTAVFFQGCPHHCIGCQNPETWDYSGGVSMSLESLIDIIKRNPLSHAVTFSGGEPFEQAEGLAELAERLKHDGYEIAVYSGYTYEQLLTCSDDSKHKLLSLIDVLIDGRFDLSKRSLELSFRGSFNQRIIDVQQSLKENRVVLETSHRWLGE